MYRAVHVDSALNGVPVFDFTGGSTNEPVAGVADYANIHVYPANGDEPAWYIPANNTADYGNSVLSPEVVTEAGYDTDIAAADGVSLDAQAKMTLNLLMDAAQDGVSQTYLYELLDDNPDPGNLSAGQHWGLFNSDNSPKPVAVAIHDLSAILSDNGTNNGGFIPSILPYSVAGTPWAGHSLLLEKSGGTFDIVLWNETPIWNPTTRTEIAVAAVAVSVSLGGTYATVSIYDPMQGVTPIEVLHNLSTVQVSMLDHPIIIELSVNAPAVPTVNGLTAATDTGSSNSDGITGNPKPSVVGAATAGSTVTLRDADGIVLGTTIAGAATAGATTGAWSISLTTALTAGSHALTATAAFGTATSAASLAYIVAIDTASPTVTAVASSGAAGSVLRTGQADTITITLSGPVSVSGGPELLLNDGGIATYDAADSGPNALRFDYTVAAGQVSADMMVTGLTLHGGSIVDIAGNALQIGGVAALRGSDTGLSINPPPPTTTVGSGLDALTLGVSEDAGHGDVDFRVTVDGTQVGDQQTVTAAHSVGIDNEITLFGSWGSGAHAVNIAFINAAHGGISTPDRNLYVDNVSYDGVQVVGTSIALLANGVKSLTVAAIPAPGLLTLRLAEDSYLGDARFTVTADGHQLCAAQAVTTSQTAGGSQTFSFDDLLSAGNHDIAVSFINDLYGGTPSTDRNLYIKSVDYNGTAASGGVAVLDSSGTANFGVLVPH